jgi:Xaa-Pro aminopeptidase
VTPAAPPFDADRLDALLDEQGVDVVVAISHHNVRYLLGSYSSFFASFDAIGVDRYLPAVAVPRGRLDDAFAVGHEIDAGLHEVEPPWVPTLLDRSQSAAETARLVAAQLRARGLARATVAVEQSFAPYRFVSELAAELPGARLVEATPLLEELRAVKRPDELALLREAAELVVDAIAATAAAAPGLSKRAIADRLRVEEERRGLRFEYCLVTAGTSFHRAPSEQVWAGGVLSLDSGGRRGGYIGDLCRMAVAGGPSAQLIELLAEVRAVQDAARASIRPGVPGSAIYEAADAALDGLPHGDAIVFVAHGMGLVPHEAPRLSADAPIRYPATHRERPLEAGMVLSLESDLRLDGVGLVKLEDTVAVRAGGAEGYGDAYRDWIAT